MQKDDKKADLMKNFSYDFIDKMMEVIERKLDSKTAGEILSKCHTCHYKGLDINSLTEKYSGDIDGFIEMLENEWGWKVSYDKKENLILIDENKPFCVCPLVREGNIKNELLCRCSEGFNRRMFSAVAGNTVDVTVIKSVLRGDKSCVYKAELKHHKQ